VLDLNDLKSVNDTHGHVAGDDLLRRCAEVLTGVARSSDFVARLGGDEFGVLAVETDRAGGEAQVHRLREALADARIEAAVGFSVRAPGTSFEAAYQGADQAMYRDKERRRAV
jgi:diguanylate cyclase (GGDEF)-like protein